MTVLVHDYLLAHRGAERSFAAICDLYPESPISTLFFDPEVLGERLHGHPVRTSGLQRLGVNQGNFKRLLPLLPRAAARLPVTGHDLVISSSSAFAHAVRPDPDATHVCYCYTPFRYAWYERERALQQAPSALRPPLNLLLNRLRRWDHAQAQRPTHYVAISRLSQARIRRYWGREAPIVHPPVDVERFRPGTPEDFFLFVGELVRHKQVEVALAAAEAAAVPIAIVGGGSDEHRLRARYGTRAGVTFLGRISDAELDALYPRARALVMPNVEEFGITAVESQAAGRPVIAADAGGACETVRDGETGLFFPAGNGDALARAMRDPRLTGMTPAHAVANAQRFSISAFQRGITEEISRARSAPRIPVTA